VSRAVLSIGSNLGDREANLRLALAALGKLVEVVSGVYETPPWGDPDQPSYLNAVLIATDDEDDPFAWLQRANAAEWAAGRTRDPQRPFGPRTLDVDVIAVWGGDGQPVVADDPVLTLPHPRAHLRAFVLRPWLDIEPFALLPGRGFVYELIGEAPVAGDVGGLTARPDVELR
jgi:2-amino-4-hydroxy-6-hydroxymethyldihydropteridine diphosphokinase